MNGETIGAWTEKPARAIQTKPEKTIGCWRSRSGDARGPSETPAQVRTVATATKGLIACRFGGGAGASKLPEAQMRRIESHFPLSHRIRRVNDRRIISGVIFVTRNGLRWRGAPGAGGRTCQSATPYPLAARELAPLINES
jgi:hypothetical protein